MAGLPQIQRAREYLQRGLASGLWPEGKRLPNVRILARQASVASAAMQIAVRELAAEGLFAIESNDSRSTTSVKNISRI